MRAAENMILRVVYILLLRICTTKLDIHLNTERTAIIQIFALVLANDSFFLGQTSNKH